MIGLRGAENLEGVRFGKLTIIGDTGRRTRAGNQIVIARHDDQRIIEATAVAIKNGQATGLMGSEENKEHLKKYRDIFQYIHLKEGTNLSLLKQKPRTNSGYRGVYWNSDKKSWNVKFEFKGETLLNNHFTNFEEAVLKRIELEEKYFNPILIKYGLEPLPKLDIIKNEFVKQREKERKEWLSRPLGENKHRNITWDKTRNRWVVQISVNGKSNFFGRFENLDDAISKRNEIYKIKKIKQKRMINNGI